MPEGVDPRNEAFDPRRGPIYVRSDGAEAKRKVLGWLPTRGVNRRLDYAARLLTTIGSSADPAQVLSAAGSSFQSCRTDGWLQRVNASSACAQVNHRWLLLDAPGPADPVWRCEQCRRVVTSVRSGCVSHAEL